MLIVIAGNKFGDDEKDKPIYNPTCKDEHDSATCQAQSKRGDCFAYTKHMSKYCSRTCHYCEQGKYRLIVWV